VPLTSSTVSYWPAYEAPGRSSSTAEERTANAVSPIASVLAPIASAMSSGRGVAATRATASLVSTNPSGTGKPAASSSPNAAAFRPTVSVSARVTPCRGRT